MNKIKIKKGKATLGKLLDFSLSYGAVKWESQTPPSKGAIRLQRDGRRVQRAVSGTQPPLINTSNFKPGWDSVRRLSGTREWFRS